MTGSGTIQCGDCGVETPARGATQRYCPACSTRRDLERKRLWARDHPPSQRQRERNIQHAARRTVMVREAGAQISDEAKQGIAWLDPEGPELAWMVRLAAPFTYATSKNHIYALRRSGHVALRRESARARAEIAQRVREALRGKRVAHNKVWIDLLVQKPDHRGDAINVVDLVCDAIKDAIGIDDRWFCIRRLDWEIAKSDPMLYIGIGQDTEHDAQVCSHCGLIKPLSEFTRRATSRLGVGRACRACLRAGRGLARRRAEAAT
jgi:hypothetical protein